MSLKCFKHAHCPFIVQSGIQSVCILIHFVIDTLIHICLWFYALFFYSVSYLIWWRSHKVTTFVLSFLFPSFFLEEECIKERITTFSYKTNILQLIVLFKSLRNCNRCNKGNFTFKYNINKMMCVWGLGATLYCFK